MKVRKCIKYQVALILLSLCSFGYSQNFVQLGWDDGDPYRRHLSASERLFYDNPSNINKALEISATTKSEILANIDGVRADATRTIFSGDDGLRFSANRTILNNNSDAIPDNSYIVLVDLRYESNASGTAKLKTGGSNSTLYDIATIPIEDNSLTQTTYHYLIVKPSSKSINYLALYAPTGCYVQRTLSSIDYTDYYREESGDVYDLSSSSNSDFKAGLDAYSVPTKNWP